MSKDRATPIEVSKAQQQAIRDLEVATSKGRDLIKGPTTKNLLELLKKTGGFVADIDSEEVKVIPKPK